MGLVVLNADLIQESVIDDYASLIWTDRFYACGDFEIETLASIEAITQYVEDYYIWYSESDHVMIIEGCEIKSDAEDGNRLIVTGRSLESILDRRIVWGYTKFSGKLQDGIEKLLNENAISPADPKRKIDRLIFKKSTDPRLDAITVDFEYRGENLYEVVKSMCEEKKVGFRIRLTDASQFEFELYLGSDRSYAQLENPYVVFSPDFENIITSNYIRSKAESKNVCLVGGEGEGESRIVVEVFSKKEAPSGLQRREMFADDSSKETNALKQKGLEELKDNRISEAFEGQADSSDVFVYNEDFFVGDIVQVTNEYGMGARARVVELIQNQSDDGIDVYPTFEVEKQEE